MNVCLYGGPFHGRQLQIPRDLWGRQRLEIRCTSYGRTGAPIPPERQRVAVYVQKPDQAPARRYYLGMGDES